MPTPLNKKADWVIYHGSVMGCASLVLGSYPHRVCQPSVIKFKMNLSIGPIEDTNFEQKVFDI